MVVRLQVSSLALVEVESLQNNFAIKKRKLHTRIIFFQSRKRRITDQLLVPLFLASREVNNLDHERQE